MATTTQSDNPAPAGGLDDFRITAEPERLTLLKTLIDGSVLVNLAGSDGASYTTKLWSIDDERGVMSFAADADSNAVQDLIEAEDVAAVAYLNNIKLQFDLHGLVLVHGEDGATLNCTVPRELFRFQRRSGYRVRPLLRSTPMAHLRHPMIPDMKLELRMLDLSIGGCALFLPDDVPPLQPGLVLNGVEIVLDLDTRITTSLRLQHVTSLNHEAHGVRLGCEMVNPGHEALRNLQRYIDQTQKRQRMLAR